MQLGLRPFFAPRGVAIIGASATPNKLSYGILRNMTLYGYQGQIAPVNPKADEILGLKCYPDITSVPDPLDLAVIVLPAPVIPATLEACGQRGIRAVIIISGGFKEVGEEGASLEKQILEIASRYQMRLIGPNCVGTLDLYSGLNTTFIQGVPQKGGIGFISQSGAVGGGVVDYIRNKFIGFANFASLGNEADITETDVIEYLSEEEHTRVIAVYVEMIRDGRRFMQIARQVTPQKPIVLLKAGRTGAGARAVSSHTGSLAGSHAAYRAAFQQAGVIEAQTVSDLFDISMALAHQPLPKGNRVAIITNAGGPAALLSDSLAEHGLQIADLEERTRAALRSRLNPAAQVANPIDMLGGAEPPEYEFALQQALADPNVDAAVVILVPQALVNPLEVAEKIIQVSASRQKPVLTCFMGEWSVAQARERLHGSGIPMYVFPEIPGRVLGAMLQYARWQEQPRFEASRLSKIDRSAAEQVLAQTVGQAALGEAQTRPLFEAYGIPVVAGQAAHSAEQAAEIAQKIGFPVALKIISPDILHKSDVGGIRLHLNDPQSVREAYQEMLNSIAIRLPQAHLEGVLVERMAAKGQEVIIGMRRDPNFGPLMMFGLGGIYVELFGDVSFRVAPLTRREALEMIHQTRAGTLLSGFRGEEPGDLDAVVDVILRLSQLALDFPQIAEMEVNPLRVFRQGALALDGRIILS
ncbi:MAG: acyl-CoA synthetase [Bellilinea sp.]|nr:MAG: acyl-CoA synthetase [Bellilinea sp.]